MPALVNTAESTKFSEGTVTHIRLFRQISPATTSCSERRNACTSRGSAQANSSFTDGRRVSSGRLCAGALRRSTAPVRGRMAFTRGGPRRLQPSLATAPRGREALVVSVSRSESSCQCLVVAQKTRHAVNIGDKQAWLVRTDREDARHYARRETDRDGGHRDARVRGAPQGARARGNAKGTLST